MLMSAQQSSAISPIYFQRMWPSIYLKSSFSRENKSTQSLARNSHMKPSEVVKWVHFILSYFPASLSWIVYEMMHHCIIMKVHCACEWALISCYLRAAFEWACIFSTQLETILGNTTKHTLLPNRIENAFIIFSVNGSSLPLLVHIS